MIIILKIFGDKFDISGKNFFRANPTVIGTAHFWFKILDRKSRLGIDKKNNYYNACDDIQKFLSSVLAGHQRIKPIC